MIENGDGGELDVSSDGDLILNCTLYNAVYLSLFGGKAFYDVLDNDTFDIENDDVESEFNKPATPDNLKNLGAIIASKLDWMVNSGLISSVDAAAVSGENKTTKVVLTITQPDGSVERYALVWDSEKSELKRFGEIYGRVYKENLKRDTVRYYQ